jgi:glycerophosphoryl diester phosphodiesterase
MYIRFLLCLLCFTPACKMTQLENKKTVSEEAMNKPILPVFDNEGHRGCRGLMPENTIGAMLHALAMGVTTIEMDIVISADGVPVLSHEPFFNHEISRKPDGKPVTEAEEKSLNIYHMTVKEIQSYDVGTQYHTRFPDQLKIPAVKPTLAEVFAAVKEYMMTAKRPFPFFNIETKCQPETDNRYHPEPEVFVDKIMEVVKAYQQEEQVIIQSFDPRSLQILHRKYPVIKTALLIEETTGGDLKSQLKSLGFTPDIYSPAYALVTPELIRSCHEKNIAVIPWTVNDTATIKKLKLMGVDGIISDYPNLLLQ